MNLCLRYLIYIKIAHVPAVLVFFCWAQKVNKLGPSCCLISSDFVDNPGQRGGETFFLLGKLVV